MTRRAEELRRAVAEAARIRARFPVGSRASFDVLGAVMELDIPLLFRPLKGLWGAAVTADADLRGIMVTTKLDLAVQRFTLAHELGHVLLGHGTSLDQTIGFAGRYGPASRPVEELAADTFASELLAGRDLMLSAAKRHGWTRALMGEPRNVYQLSLRLGVSFPAACWALAAHNVVSQSVARNLQNRPVKELKLAASSEALLTNPWANVWELDRGDSGLSIEAGPEDIFAVRLKDNSSAGYLWELTGGNNNCRVLEERTSELGEEYGAPSTRMLFLTFDDPGNHRLVLEHRRPWSGEIDGQIEISIDNYGKEFAGLPRRRRERALAATGVG